MPARRPQTDPAEVEAALLKRLHEHQSPTVDDLFDSLPAEEVRCLIAGLGRKAIRIELTIRKRSATKPVENSG